MIILRIILALLLVFVIGQYIELKKFRVTEYKCFSEKLHQEQRLVVLADLHGFVYGRRNKRLIGQIRSRKPDAILIAGDMIVAGKRWSHGRALETLEQLTGIAPVYYSFGNHESHEERGSDSQKADLMAYQEEAEKQGVIFLHNRSEKFINGSDILAISGVEISQDFYVKMKTVPMEGHYVQELLGPADQERFQILLAHNPAYSEKYAAWGADLTFCGHNHGGLIRLPGRGSLLSPQLTLFPKYDGGQYEIAGKQVIVSRGLGTHTFHFRIFNRAEVVFVRALPK